MNWIAYSDNDARYFMHNTHVFYVVKEWPNGQGIEFYQAQSVTEYGDVLAQKRQEPRGGVLTASPDNERHKPYPLIVPSDAIPELIKALQIAIGDTPSAEYNRLREDYEIAREELRIEREHSRMLAERVSRLRGGTPPTTTPKKKDSES